MSNSITPEQIGKICRSFGYVTNDQRRDIEAAAAKVLEGASVDEAVNAVLDDNEELFGSSWEEA